MTATDAAKTAAETRWRTASSAARSGAATPSEMKNAY
jgi:hypothetical protein